MRPLASARHCANHFMGIISLNSDFLSVRGPHLADEGDKSQPSPGRTLDPSTSLYHTPQGLIKSELFDGPHGVHHHSQDKGRTTMINLFNLGRSGGFAFVVGGKKLCLGLCFG